MYCLLALPQRCYLSVSLKHARKDINSNAMTVYLVQENTLPLLTDLRPPAAASANSMQRALYHICADSEGKYFVIGHQVASRITLIHLSFKTEPFILLCQLQLVVMGDLHMSGELSFCMQRCSAEEHEMFCMC